MEFVANDSGYSFYEATAAGDQNDPTLAHRRLTDVLGFGLSERLIAYLLSHALPEDLRRYDVFFGGLTVFVGDQVPEHPF